MSDDLTLNDGSKRLDPNKNDYFLVTITDLLPGKTYPIEFRWNYKDPTKKGEWGAVLNVVTPGYAPGAPVITSVSWPKEIFTLVFTHNRTSAENLNVTKYQITLVASDSTERIFEYTPKPNDTTHTFTRGVEQIIAAFGLPLYAFSGSVVAVDKNGIKSAAATFPLTTATTSLPAPSITVASAVGGYTVSYTTPSSTTYPNYSHINIEEVESSAGSDPAAGYAVVFSGVANPVIMSRSGSAQRWVRAKFISKTGLPGPYSTAYAVTPTPAVVVDTIAPSAPASGALTAGIDNTAGATIGFNAYVDVSWNAVSDSTLRGYRIRFRRDGSSDPYSYVDSPGSGTSFRLSGLAIGTTYEIGVASYDEINNTSSSYTSLGTATATGTPFIGKNITTQGYFGASATGDTGEFRFGYGVESGRRGLRFDANNYWYIDSSAAASFRLGGSSSNYLQWNGATFTIDGDLTARSGAFRGNVQIISGSLFAGASASSGARLAISSTGLTAYDSNGTATTNIYSNANAGGVTFDTIAGTIGNWSITNSSITKTLNNGTLTLDSSAARITASGTTAAYVVGMAAPTNNAPSDIVLYAGSTTPGSAPFRVRADGAVTMTSATITGYVGASDVVNHIGGLNTTTISGGVITTGTINLNNVNVNTGTGNNSIRLSSVGLELYDGSGTRTVYLNPSNGSASFTGTITGSTITGGRIRTAESGDRIELNDPSYLNEIVLHAGSTFPGRISGFTSGSNGQLRIRAPYASGSSIAQIDLYSLGANTFFDITSSLVNAGSSLTSPIIYTGLGTDDETNTNAGVYINSSGKMVARRNGTTPMFSHRTDGNGRVITFLLAGSSGGGINATAGGTPTFAAASDYRLKENIVDYINATDRIKAARLRKFNLKSIPDKEFVGFIAHEFAEVDPEFVIGEKDAVDENGDPIYQEIGTTNLIYYLTGALKESIIKIEELEQRLDALEG